LNTAKYVYTTSDNFGDLAVIDEGEQRILSFGVGDEQSVQLKAQPHVLQHAYTQAMMLALLFNQPKRVLLLGLGAGSLLSAFHHSVSGVRIDAVEVRASVIDIAKRYFRLPSGKKINLHCAEAGEFLAAGLDKKVDLIMTDLYTENGMDEVQISEQYLDACVDGLKVDGWLVLNCWGILEDHAKLFKQLNKHFADLRCCESGDGNVVIFAGRQKDLKNKSDLKTLATKLSAQLGFNLQPFLSNLVQVQH
jgi:spermidine synthase